MSSNPGARLATALDDVIAAIDMTEGPCRFESGTFGSSGLVVPAIRGAVERLVGGLLLRAHSTDAPATFPWVG